MTTRTSRASFAVPAVASFLWPGLGHWMLGRRSIGLLLALPQLALLVIVGLGLANGRATLLGWLIDPTILVGVLAFNLVMFLARAYAVAGSTAVATHGRPNRLAVLLVAVLVMVSAIGYGQLARIGWAAHETVVTVFDPSGPAGAGFGGLPSPTPSPTPPPWANATPEPSFVIPTQAPPRARTGRTTAASTCCSSAPTPGPAAGSCAPTP